MPQLTKSVQCFFYCEENLVFNHWYIYIYRYISLTEKNNVTEKQLRNNKILLQNSLWEKTHVMSLQNSHRVKLKIDSASSVIFEIVLMVCCTSLSLLFTLFNLKDQYKQNCKVTLGWVPGHEGIQGNE
ncbi:hypothetical protein J6590_056146 [Homalodisca vitripennis]|nr:hypothetical protein J6590_056146 [Homalodisca vitripennis]